ncbi:MAG TPA: C40 family peptidase [Spirochaetia bacterium]
MNARRAAVVLLMLAGAAVLVGAQNAGHPAVKATLAATVKTATRPPVPPLSAPDAIVQSALAYLGVPYVHGGDDRGGFDCSGLVYRVFHDMTGAELSRGVLGLYHSGTLATSPLHIGDLLFFDTDDAAPSAATHVGVYAGNGKFIHAASEGPRTGVIVSALESPYYKDRFLGARRVIAWRAPRLDVTVTDDHVAAVQTDPFPSREPITIRIFNGMSGGGPVDLYVTHENAQVLSRRIVPGAQKPVEIELTPDIGTWSVQVTRIWKGRELANVTFTVRE